MMKRVDLIVLQLVCVLAVLITRGLWLQPGQLGRNWDFSFTDNQNLQSNTAYSLTSWSYYQLGYSSPLLLAQKPVNLLYESIVKIVGHRFATFTLIYFVIVISFLSYSKLLSIFVKIPIISILYAFSPFLFSDLIGGAWYSWVSYAISPLLIHYLGYYFFKPRKVILYKVLLLSLFSVSFLQYFLISLCLGFIYGFVLAKGIGRWLKTSISLLGSLCITHLHWLIPFLLVSQSQLSKLFDQKTTSTISYEGYFYAKQGLFQAFGLLGYLDRNFFYFSLPNILKPILLILVVLIFIRQIVLLKFSRSISIIFLIFLLSNILQKGGVWPFADTFEKFMRKIPIMEIFRSPQRLMIIAAILAPILLSLIWQNSGKFWKAIICSYVSVILLGWLVRGDLGIRNLTYFSMSHPVMFEDDQVLRDFYTKSEASTDLYRIAVLPASASPIFVNTAGVETQGGVPEYLYLRNNTFTEEGSVQGKLLNSYFCDLTSDPSDQKIYDENAVKYIIHRKDLKLIFSICNFLWNPKLVTKKLNANQNLVLINSDDRVDIYQNLKYLPMAKISDTYLQPYEGNGGNITITKPATVSGTLTLKLPYNSLFIAREFTSKPTLADYLSNFKFLNRVQSGSDNLWVVNKDSTFIKIEYLPQLFHYISLFFSIPVLFLYIKLFNKNVLHHH